MENKWDKYVNQKDKQMIIYKKGDYPSAVIETLVLVSTGQTHYLAYVNFREEPPQMFDTLVEAILYIKKETKENEHRNEHRKKTY